MNDTQLLDWLESRFTGDLRHSIFLTHEIGGKMIYLDERHTQVVHRAKTVRGCIKLAMLHAYDAP